MRRKQREERKGRERKRKGKGKDKKHKCMNQDEQNLTTQEYRFVRI